MTFSITTLSIMTSYAYAECHFIMVSVSNKSIMQNVVLLNVIMLTHAAHRTTYEHIKIVW
jgi:hypothetical protein